MRSHRQSSTFSSTAYAPDPTSGFGEPSASSSNHDFVSPCFTLGFLIMFFTHQPAKANRLALSCGHCHGPDNLPSGSSRHFKNPNHWSWSVSESAYWDHSSLFPSLLQKPCKHLVLHLSRPWGAWILYRELYSKETLPGRYYRACPPNCVAGKFRQAELCVGLTLSPLKLASPQDRNKRYEMNHHIKYCRSHSSPYHLVGEGPAVTIAMEGTSSW